MGEVQMMSSYINRAAEVVIEKMMAMFKVVLVTGPRQVGKTTLLKHLLGDEYRFVTLDDVNELQVARSDQKLFFLNHPGKLIIDEVQQAPELFSEIKRLVDESDEPGRFVLTGSQTYQLMSHVSESLAGRIGIMELSGLSLREIRGDRFDGPFVPDRGFVSGEGLVGDGGSISGEGLDSGEGFVGERVKMGVSELWKVIHRGSMPELYRNPEMDWQLYYAAYVRTYLERDVRALVQVKDLTGFSSFLVAMAARTGQVLNYSAVAGELGVSEKTVKSWVSVLEASGLLILVPAFSNNRLQRAIKTPMMYFLDTGLVCYLLKWLSPETLMNGAMAGPILKTYAVAEIVKSYKNQGILDVPIFFYRDKDQKEIDLIVERSGVLYPIEIKKSASPKKNMARHLSILVRAVDYMLGTKTILCLIDKKMFLDRDLLAYPIMEI